MQNDPIIDEIRRVRDEHAAKFNYNLDAIFADLKRQEQESGRAFVSYEPYEDMPAGGSAADQS